MVPVIRYRDLPAAIGWLCNAFGFEKQRIVVDRNGAISFAQLTYGGSLIMVGAVRASAFDKLMKQPDEVGGAETQVCYLFVADARVHCGRAMAAGADIVFHIEDKENGGRSYTCRDPEGHLWNFGTYNPWLHHVSGDVSIRGSRHREYAKRLLLICGLMTGVAAVTVPANNEGFRREPVAIETGSIAALEDSSALKRSVRHEADDADARNTAAITERLARTQQEMAATRKDADETREKLLQAVRDKEVVNRRVKDLRDRLGKASVELRLARQRMKQNATAGASTW